MISINVIQQSWEKVKTTGSQGELVAAYELTQDLRYGKPFLTIDFEGKRHLLLPLPKVAKVVEDKQSAGIHILRSSWGLENERRDYIDLVCLKPNFNDLFNIIIYETLQGLAENASDVNAVCHTVLESWREFLNRESRKMPDKSTLIGLMGELFVLKNLVHLDPRALRIWTGPQGARFDFFSKNTAFEVKSSTKRHGRTVIINGVDQLDPPAGVNLYLFYNRVEESPLNGITLSAAVNELQSAGCDSAQLVRLLSDLGFTPEVIARFDTASWRLIESLVFRVDENFPRITARSFINGQMPPGVIAVTYEIDLGGTALPKLSETEVTNLHQLIVSESTR